MKLNKTETMVAEKLARRGEFACDEGSGVRVQRAALSLVEKGIAVLVRKETYRYEQPHKVGSTCWVSHHTGTYLKIKLN